MNKKWSEKTAFEKTLDIIAGIALCAWVVFEVLDRRGLSFADEASCIALTIVCACEAFNFWKTKRIFSYVAIAGAVIIIAAMVLKILFVA